MEQDDTFLDDLAPVFSEQTTRKSMKLSIKRLAKIQTHSRKNKASHYFLVQLSSKRTCCRII